MRKNSILEIQENINKQIGDLTISVQNNNINRVLLKNILENLRSCLDYIAQDLHDLIGLNRSRVYYPYGENLEKFENAVRGNLPGLAELYPDVYNFIIQTQAFACGDDWLYIICKKVNAAKHNDLNLLELKKLVTDLEIPLLRFSDVPDIQLTNIGVPGCFIKSIVIENYEIKELIVDDESVIEIKEKNKFHFSDQTHDIIEFLNSSTNKIVQLTNNIYQIIDS